MDTLPSAPIGENVNNDVPEEEVEVGVKRKGGRRGDEESPAVVHAESSAIAGMYRLRLLLLCRLLSLLMHPSPSYSAGPPTPTNPSPSPSPSLNPRSGAKVRVVTGMVMLGFVKDAC